MIFNSEQIKILNINKRSKEAGAIRFDKGSPSPSIPGKWDKATISSLTAQLSGNINSYPDEKGYQPLLDLIKKIEFFTNGLRLKNEEIVLTNGALSGLFYTFGTFFNRGDSVVINELSFEGFTSILKTLGLKIVTADFSNPSSIEKAIKKSKPKAIIINNPENPSGKMYDENFLKFINQISRERDLLVISDEVNNQNVYPPFKFISPSKHISRDRLILINSFSKNYFLSGVRVGWIVAKTKFMDKLKSVVSVSQVAISMPSQIVVYSLINSYQKQRLEFKKKLLQNKKVGEKNLNNLGMEYLKPITGGSVFFVNVGMDSEKLSKLLLEKYKIGVVPGGYFGAKWKNWVRIGFGAVTEKEINKNLPIIAKVLGM